MRTHSLRAVTPDELAAIVSLAGSGPIHIHVAEQVKEVEDCLSWSGLRPVQWLLDHVPIDRRWCLIHATHMTDEEARSMAASGAIRRPLSHYRSHLGDGIFKRTGLFRRRGAFWRWIGLQVLIGAADELRQLEYSQRPDASREKRAGDDQHSLDRAACFSKGRSSVVRRLSARPAVWFPAIQPILSVSMPTTSRLRAARVTPLLDSWVFGSKVCCGLRLDIGP